MSSSFVLVHGGAHGAWCWNPLLPHLEGPVLAVDLPRIDEPFLRWLRDRPGEPTAVPRVDGRLQLVCARYSGEALLAAGSLIAGGVRSLHELLDVVEFDVVDEAEWCTVADAGTFADVDTPEDATSLGIELPGLA